MCTSAKQAVKLDKAMDLGGCQVHWQGADGQGQPILVLSPAAVLASAHPPPLDKCAEAVISQVQSGIRRLVRHDTQASGMIVVVVDARGVSGIQVARYLISSRLLWACALALAGAGN